MGARGGKGGREGEKTFHEVNEFLWERRRTGFGPLIRSIHKHNSSLSRQAPSLKLSKRASISAPGRQKRKRSFVRMKTNGGACNRSPGGQTVGPYALCGANVGFATFTNILPGRGLASRRETLSRVLMKHLVTQHADICLLD